MGVKQKRGKKKDRGGVDLKTGRKTPQRSGRRGLKVICPEKKKRQKKKRDTETAKSTGPRIERGKKKKGS